MRIKEVKMKSTDLNFGVENSLISQTVRKHAVLEGLELLVNDGVLAESKKSAVD